ncbi:MAG TPA: 3'-5' exonuclease, partial [Alphaproteobacteria bacterium]|nr:3'-5' exonuclease [Alphaproteobacteria bacterium]
QKKYPEIAEIFQKEAARVHAAIHRLQALRFLHWQRAWHGLLAGLFQTLRAAKIQRAVMSYDDLILKTRALLQDPSVCSWVLYKLDGGIDHLLVDEAQDTSPAQWDILFALLEEFLSGQGAREDVPRTLFVVGDEKQSIFSFQGADRARYLTARQEIFAQLAAARRQPHSVDKTLSYRAPSAILNFVDAVFADENARAGVAENIRHQSARTGAPGYVELWPPVMGAETELPAPWTPPMQREESKPAAVQLAENIASTIRRWLSEGRRLASENRAVEAGDVMILLQRRSKLLLPIVRALKDAQVPVAGVDQMVLCRQPAVQDVLSLCRFLLLPEDDLVLAEVLRGPLVRLSDEQLFALAYGRGEMTLWHSLQAKAAQDAAFSGTVSYLKYLLAITDYVPPFTLLNEVLFKPCPADELSGQHALARRLGPDAVDPLEELLASALLQESAAPSLQLFVQAVAGSEQTRKRELSKPGGQVRVLTVHSAKGLEAPIVFVPDLNRQTAKKPEPPPIYWDESGLPLCTGAADADIALMQEARSQAAMAGEEENRRLLYVALTRPRDVLILCGVAENEAQQRAPWFEFCRRGMERLGAGPDAEGIWRYGDAHALA